MLEMMGEMDIAFPHLGIYLRNVPKMIMVGKFEIALYGIMVAAAMLAGISIAAHIGKKTGQNPDLYWDAFPLIVVCSIVGARIYYVIFMWDYYKNDLPQIFNLRAGGLAIYGGIILTVTMLFFYCRRRKEDPFLFLDTIGHGLVIGQVIGRWGNFFNREVFGEYTDSLLAMRLPESSVRAADISPLIREHMEAGTNYIQVHPTFLYEGLWNLMVFAILLLYRKRKKFNGELFLVYLAGYGIGRAIIEMIRTDQLYIPGTKVPVSMVLGLVIAVLSILTIIIGRKRASSASGSDESKPEELKAEDSKSDESKPEELKAEDSKSDESKPEKPKPE